MIYAKLQRGYDPQRMGLAGAMKNSITGAFLSCLAILIVSWTANAQSASSTVQLDATGEYRIATNVAAETGTQLASAIARQSLLREAAAQLRNSEDIKAVPLKTGQLDALLPAILEVYLGAVKFDRQGNATTYRVTVTTHLVPSQIARRMDKLRKDPNAVAGLLEVSRQAEELYRLLPGANSTKEQEMLAIRFRANALMSQSYAAFAKIEESRASARVASKTGLHRALQLSEAALILEPGLPESHLLAGDILVELNHTSVAEELYREAVSLAPSSVRAHIKLADALRREDKATDAIGELREALKLDPNSAVAHNDLGFVLGNQQNTAESMAEYRESIRLDPDLVEPHNYLAIALARSGKLPEAVAEFREIIRIDPESVLGYYNLAIALADMEKDSESSEALRSAVHFNPYHFNAHYNLAEMFRLEGKYEDAVKQFREYLRMAPNIPQNQRNIQRASEFVRTHEEP